MSSNCLRISINGHDTRLVFSCRNQLEVKPNRRCHRPKASKLSIGDGATIVCHLSLLPYLNPQLMATHLTGFAGDSAPRVRSEAPKLLYFWILRTTAVSLIAPLVDDRLPSLSVADQKRKMHCSEQNGASMCIGLLPWQPFTGLFRLTNRQGHELDAILNETTLSIIDRRDTWCYQSTGVLGAENIVSGEPDRLQ